MIKSEAMAPKIFDRILEGTVLLIFVGLATILYDLKNEVKDVGTKVSVVTEKVENLKDRIDREVTICCTK